MNHLLTRDIFLASCMVPRGPSMGCHVAPYYGLNVMLEFTGVEPRTSRTSGKCFGKG
jgi:hypothetical protein